MITNKVPILVVDNFFLFPKHESSLLINDYENKIFIQSCIKTNGYLIILPNIKKEEKRLENLEKEYFERGVLVKIINLVVNPNSAVKISRLVNLKGVARIKIISLEKENNINWGTYEILTEEILTRNQEEEIESRFINNFRDIIEKTKISTDKLPRNMSIKKETISDFIDLIAQNSKEIDKLTKWGILVSSRLEERLELLFNSINRKQIDRKIKEETKFKIKNQQDEYYLREQIKIIKIKLDELRDKEKRENKQEEEEQEDYRKRLENNPYPQNVKRVIRKEIKNYESMFPYSSEANVIKSYIDHVLDLPWWQESQEIKDLNFARRKLDENHYGLTEIKQRIIEYLAVKQRVDNVAGQIICLVGPAGTGKTSLASSIAEATGRTFVCFSVAGIKDVSEIRGHRRTYVAAMSGRIIQNIKKAQVLNPLILIDEIDKISYRSDPSDALLEILDPEQNKTFIDDYLGNDIPYDLSKVMFICTANNIWDIPSPLLDRLEVIQLYSYTELEKFRIAKKYLLPRNLSKYKVSQKEVKISDNAQKSIIKYYTRETGVRELNRKISSIIRKYILWNVEKKIKKIIVSTRNLSKFFKKRIYDYTSKQKKGNKGVATGLAWTGAGGDILLIEASYSLGKGELSLTGNLGNIMKESARVSLAFVKSNYKKFGIDSNIFKENDINIHVLEGAIPKDGPSAGVALVSAIISSLTGKVISKDVGMTGEITLHGKVEIIGGLKEKAIAAHRSELKTIIIPKTNEKDIDDIPLEIRKNLEIFVVENYDEIWNRIFLSN